MLDRLGWELAGVCGIDPRPLTLRELSWAADGRQRAEWCRAASIGAGVVQSLGGGEVDPLKLIPPRYQPARPELAARQGAGLRVMESLLSRL